MSDYLKESVEAVVGMLRSSAGEALSDENAKNKGVEITIHPNPPVEQARTPVYVRLFNNDASANISQIALAPDKVMVSYKDGTTFEQAVTPDAAGTSYVVSMAGDQLGNRNPQISIVGGKDAKAVALEFEHSGKSWPTTVGVDVSEAPTNSSVNNLSAPTKIEVSGLHGDRLVSLLTSENNLPNQVKAGDLTLVNAVGGGMSVVDKKDGDPLEALSVPIGPRKDGSAAVHRGAIR